MSDIKIENIEKYQRFLKNYTNNQLSKDKFDNITKMNENQFNNYLILFEEKLDKFKLNDKFKLIIIGALKKSYDNSKLSKENLKLSKYYYEAKKDIDDLINSEKANVKKEYELYMMKIGYILLKYKELNIYEKKSLMNYFIEKKNLSQREVLILSLKIVNKYFNKKIEDFKKKEADKKDTVKKEKVKKVKVKKEKVKKSK
jgi:hypothetical protein